MKQYSTLKDQANILKKTKMFKPGTAYDLTDPKTMPDGAELYALIPSWKNVADTYHGACNLVMIALAKSRGKDFYNYREGQIDDKHLRQLAPRNIDGVIAVQLGKKYRGKSVIKVRSLFLKGTGIEKNGCTEILLGLYELAIILLCNPGIKYEDRWWGIDCSGDEWSPGGDGSFSRAPSFFFFDWLRFGAGVVGDARDDFGSASGFVPQSNLDTRPIEASENLGLEARIKVAHRPPIEDSV